MSKLLFLPLLLFFAIAYGQQPFTVKGMVVDTTGQPLSGVTIKLLTQGDSAVSSSDKTGVFSFSKNLKSEFTLVVTSIGLQPYVQTYPAASQPVFQLKPIVMM